MQCLILTALMSVVWLVAGYSLSFDDGNQLIGTLTGKAFLAGIYASYVPEGSTIPEGPFFAFQMTFAVITPGLMIGAFAERIRFSAVLLFSTLWLCDKPVGLRVDVDSERQGLDLSSHNESGYNM